MCTDLTLAKINGDKGTLGALSNRELQDRLEGKISNLQKAGITDNFYEGYKEGLKYVLALVQVHD